jgi:hypothetical protein
MKFAARFLAGFVLVCALALPASASSQGCSACRDNVAGSAPKVQQGFRRAIPVLAIPAVAIFAGILLLGWRSRTAADQ